MKAVYIDLETGGLDPATDAITEAAAVAFTARNGKAAIAETFSCRVVPHPRARVCLAALQVQGLASFGALHDTTRPGGSAKTEKEAFNGLIALLGAHLGAGGDWWPALWAHNAAFDAAFCHHWEKRAMGHLCIDPEDMYHFPSRPTWQCSKGLYRLLMAPGGPVKPGGTSLDDCCKTFGVNRAQPHGALTDALAGAECVALMLAALAPLWSVGGKGGRS